MWHSGKSKLQEERTDLGLLGTGDGGGVENEALGDLGDGGSSRTTYTEFAKKFALSLELIYRTEIESQTENKLMITEGKG